jgi:hypothetical protein
MPTIRGRSAALTETASRTVNQQDVPIDMDLLSLIAGSPMISSQSAWIPSAKDQGTQMVDDRADHAGLDHQLPDAQHAVGNRDVTRIVG